MSTSQFANTAHALQRLAQDNAQSAWAYLIKTHGSDIYRVCRKIVGEQHLADDACQETFLIVRQRAATFRGSEDFPEATARAWILKIASRVSLIILRDRNNVRRRELRAAEETMQHSHSDMKSDESEDILEEIRRELTLLDERIRQPLVLHYFAGLDHLAVAEILGCSPVNARVRIHRALEYLRERLASKGRVLSVGVLTAAMTANSSGSTAEAADILAKLAQDHGTLPTIPFTEGISIMTKISLVSTATCAVAALIVGIAALQMPADEGDATPRPQPLVVQAEKPEPKPIVVPQKDVLSFKTGIWKKQENLPDGSMPVGMSEIGNNVLIHLFNKQRGAGAIIGSAVIAHADATAALQPVNNISPLGKVIAHGDRLIQSQVSSDRISWNIANVAVNKDEPHIIELGNYPQFNYVHQTHVVQTNDGKFHALAGMYQNKNNKEKSVYEYVMSRDGIKWSKPDIAFNDFSAHDDIPTQLIAFNDKLLFFGRKSAMNSGSLMVFENDEWHAAPQLNDRLDIVSFKVVNDRLILLYGSVSHEKLTLKITSTTDLKKWEPSHVITEGLTYEDPLTQIAPSLVVHDKQLLVSFADIYGNWSDGEFKARMMISEDAGVTWATINPPGDQQDPPKFILASWCGSGLVAICMRGNIRKPTCEIWRMIPDPSL